MSAKPDIRDGIILLATQGNKFWSGSEMAAALGLKERQVTNAASKLIKGKILIGRRREGSKSFEYAAGPRINWAVKYRGRKFPWHKGAARAEARALKYSQPSREPTPVEPGVAGACLVVRFNGEAHAVTMPEARIIYDDLRTLFGE